VAANLSNGSICNMAAISAHAMAAVQGNASAAAAACRKQPREMAGYKQRKLVFNK